MLYSYTARHCQISTYAQYTVRHATKKYVTSAIKWVTPLSGKLRRSNQEKVRCTLNSALHYSRPGYSHTHTRKVRSTKMQNRPNNNGGTSSFTYIVVFLMLGVAFYMAVTNPSISKQLSSIGPKLPGVASGANTTGSTSTGTGVNTGPSLSAAQVDNILCNENSPMCGTGATIYADSVKYSIDDRYFLGVTHAESTDGINGMPRATKGPANIRCSAGYSCINGYRSYATWSDGINDWYWLISDSYINKWGLTTVSAIANKYAPNSENPTSQYIQNIETRMNALR